MEMLRQIESEGGRASFFRPDLLAPMYATRLTMDAMRRRGGGAIVNITSASAFGHGRDHAQVPAFDVAKSGLIRFTIASPQVGAIQVARHWTPPASSGSVRHR